MSRTDIDYDDVKSEADQEQEEEHHVNHHGEVVVKHSYKTRMTKLKNEEQNLVKAVE